MAYVVIPFKVSHTHNSDRCQLAFAPKLDSFLSQSTISTSIVPLHLLCAQSPKFARQYHCSARHFHRFQPRRKIIRAVSGQNTHRRVLVTSGSTDSLADEIDSSDLTRLHEQINPIDSSLGTATMTIEEDDDLDNDISVDDWVMREGFRAAAEEPPDLEPPNSEPNYTPYMAAAPSLEPEIATEAASSKNAKAVFAHNKYPVFRNQKESTSRLTHLTFKGEARMVDISRKKVTNRSATAMSRLYFGSAETIHAMNESAVGKGDVIAVARIAGIQAAKRTPDLIPLAHPGLGLTGVLIDISYLGRGKRSPFGGFKVTAKVSCSDKTGVEMEALTAATVTALTLFDMLKGTDKQLSIGSTRVIAKSGGKSGDWIFDAETQKLKSTSARADSHLIHNSDLEVSKSSLTREESPLVDNTTPDVNELSPVSEIATVTSDVIQKAGRPNPASENPVLTPETKPDDRGSISVPNVTSASSDQLPDSSTSTVASSASPFPDMIADPVSRSRSDEIGYLSLKEREFQITLKRIKWREERLRHERKLLDLQAEVTQLERRKMALAERDIEAEIQKGIDIRLRKMGTNKKLMAMELHAARRKENGETAQTEITEKADVAANTFQSTSSTGDTSTNEKNTRSPLSSSYLEPTSQSSAEADDSSSTWSPSPSHSELEKQYNPEVTTIRLRDLTSGLGLDKADAEDFQQSRLQRYRKWSDER